MTNKTGPTVETMDKSTLSADEIAQLKEVYEHAEKAYEGIKHKTIEEQHLFRTAYIAILKRLIHS